MEFKGTKGNWKLAENEYGYYTSVRNLDDSRKVCTSRVNNQIESNANLLLISKAPEMVEMLKEMFDEWCETGIGENKLSEYMLKSKKLIKEATEL